MVEHSFSIPIKLLLIQIARGPQMGPSFSSTVDKIFIATHIFRAAINIHPLPSENIVKPIRESRL